MMQTFSNRMDTLTIDTIVYNKLQKFIVVYCTVRPEIVKSNGNKNKNIHNFLSKSQGITSVFEGTVSSPLAA